jgi:hypothetical protein
MNIVKLHGQPSGICLKKVISSTLCGGAKLKLKASFSAGIQLSLSAVQLFGNADEIRIELLAW